MTESPAVPYVLAAVAGICFIQGLAILSNGRMVGHGTIKRDRLNA